MINNAPKSAFRVLQALSLAGIRDVVLSPGSRNAPLMIALRHFEHIRVHISLDERSAAYVALGMAQASAKMVAVCCTSGTAAANFYPAVCEAFYQKIPLLLLTADRPQRMVDQRSGQTIRQRGLFDTHLRASLFIEAGEEEAVFLDKIEKLKHYVLQKTAPFHLNLALDEPLYDSFNEPSAEVNAPFAENAGPFDAISLSDCRHFSKVMLLCGQMESDTRLQPIIRELAAKGVVVLGEALSNIQEAVIPLTEALFKGETDKQKPEFLITIGRDVVSKQIKNYFSENKPKVHLHIELLNEGEKPADPFSSITEHISADPAVVLAHLVNELNPNSDYRAYWHAKREKIAQKQGDFAQKAEWSDFVAMKMSLESLPGDYAIHLGNSSLVRYALLFPDYLKRKVFSNRGTAGIDGSLSTALGQALVLPEPMLCMLGDLSFFYDNNALWLQKMPENFKIIVINNGCGHIFQLIEGPEKQQDIHEWQQFPHGKKAKDLAKMHGIMYQEATNSEELISSLHKFWQQTEPALLEIVTSAERSTDVFNQYRKFVNNG